MVVRELNTFVGLKQGQIICLYHRHKCQLRIGIYFGLKPLAVKDNILEPEKVAISMKYTYAVHIENLEQILEFEGKIKSIYSEWSDSITEIDTDDLWEKYYDVYVLDNIDVQIDRTFFVLQSILRNEKLKDYIVI